MSRESERQMALLLEAFQKFGEGFELLSRAVGNSDSPTVARKQEAFNPTDAARYIGVSVSTLNRLRRRNLITHCWQYGRTPMFAKDDLESLMERLGRENRSESHG